MQRLQNGIVGLLAVVVAAGSWSCSNAQDKSERIVIYNQDGEKGDADRLKLELKGDVVLDQDGGVTSTIHAQDGKIIVVGSDGKKREIDVSDAESIIINQSVKSLMKDGEKQTAVQGKAIVVGPDGVRREFELAGPMEFGEGAARLLMVPDRMKALDGELRIAPKLQMWKGDMTELPGQLRMLRGSISKYMIGVNCSPVSESLRHHLDLPSGIGLIVENTTDGSPASEAGIQKHDILFRADETELTNTEDLVNIIKKAGEEDRSVNIDIVRAGKERTIEVKPTERPESDLSRLQFELGDLELSQVAPGIIIENEKQVRDQFEQQMKQLEQQMQRMRQQMQRMRKLEQEIEGDSDDDSER